MWEEILETQSGLNWNVDEKRQVWVGEDSDSVRILEVRPPLPYPSLVRGMELDQYLGDFDEEDIPTYGMFLMQLHLQ